MRSDELPALARKHGLGDHVKELTRAARPAVLLVPGSTSASRLGGLPSLAADAEWPSWRGRPMALLAELRLDEVAPLDDERVLPGSGSLLFFYDSVALVYGRDADVDPKDGAGWGFDPADAGSARVVHVERPSSPREPPEGLHPEAILPRLPVAPRARLTLPPPSSTAFDPLREELDVVAYLELLDELDERAPVHQLLGHPDQIQGDMQLEAQLVTHGLYCGDETGYDDPRARELEPGAADWRLLLQVDSDEEHLGVMWGDAGLVYVWIREADLRARRFDAVWAILQCY